MSDLVAIAYPDLATAQEVAGNAGRAVQAHELELDDMVIVERRHDGKVKLHQAVKPGAAEAVPQRLLRQRGGFQVGRMPQSGNALKFAICG